MTWPAVLFWLLLAWGLASRRAVLVYLFFASAPFGSLAVLPVEAVGGLNLLPQSVTAVAILLRLGLDPPARRRALEIMADPRRLGLLMLFLAVAAVVTLFMPRLFAGAVDVVSMGGALQGPQPLAPGPSNFTQVAYLTLSVLTVVTFAVMAETPGAMVSLARAQLVGGLVLAATGLAALIADQSGAKAALEPFRTVAYVLLTDDVALDTRRLTGLMPEASAFGGLCVVNGAALAFLHPCYPRLQRPLATMAALALFAMAALSTSSTAYVGLGMVVALLVANWLRRLMTPGTPNPTSGSIEFVVVTGCCAGLLILYLMNSSWIAYAHDMIDVVLFQKVTSASYLERMRWNDTALDGFFATRGLGVGLGSARASNWFIALISNTGLVGAGLMLAFIVQSFRRRPAPGDAVAGEFVWAMKAVLLLSLALGALAGTSADFGVGVAAVYGMLSGLAGGLRPSEAPAAPRPSRPDVRPRRG